MQQAVTDVLWKIYTSPRCLTSLFPILEIP